MEKAYPENRITAYIPVKRDPWFGLFQLEVPETGDRIPVRRIGEMHLIERSDWCAFVQDQYTTDRLVGDGHLTSYHSNGQPKRRKANGRLPNNKTYYDLVEWREIDFNNI